MSSLLSPFHFGQKRAYFHAQITIHELTNVPLVDGHFHCKWNVKGTNSLHTLQHAATAAAHQHGYDRQHNKQGQSQTVREGHSASTDPSEGHPSSSSSTSSSSSRTNLGRQPDKLLEGSPAEVSRETSQKDTVRTDFGSGINSSQPRSLRHSESKATIDSTRSSILQRPGSGPSSSPEQSTKERNGSEGPHRVNFFSEFVDKIKAKDHGPGEEERDGQGVSKDRTAGNGQAVADTSSRATLDAHGDEGGPSRLTRRGSGGSRRTTASTKTAASKSSKQTDALRSDGHRRDAIDKIDPFLFFKQQPKGETESERVREHSVKWNTSLRVGVRVPIEKPRPTNQQGNSSASSLYSRDGGERGSRSRRDNQEARSNYGLLAASELRISVKQDLTTHVGTNKAKTPDAPSRLGYITLNLAEYAPDPPPASSSSHHNHHHHHHHHHLHFHRPNTDGQTHQYHDQHGQMRTSRSETRRYLLNDSKTNATLKVTVEMTYIGGSREYVIPPLTNGLLAGGVSQMIGLLGNSLDHVHRRHQGGQNQGRDSQHSSGSDGSISRRNALLSGSLALAPGSANQRSFPGRGQVSASSLSLPQYSGGFNSSAYYSPALQNAQKRKIPNRIPLSSITAESQDSQPSRMSPSSASPSFFGDLQHDKPPEDIINAIFSDVKRKRTRPERRLAEPRPESDSIYRSEKTPRERRGSQPAPDERLDPRARTVSIVSNISKRSDRSNAFGHLHCGINKDKDRDRDKDKDPSKDMEQDKDRDRNSNNTDKDRNKMKPKDFAAPKAGPETAASESFKKGPKSSARAFRVLSRGNAKGHEAPARTADLGSSTVPAIAPTRQFSGPNNTAATSDAASDPLVDFGQPSPDATTSEKEKKLSQVRWDVHGSSEANGLRRPASEAAKAIPSQDGSLNGGGLLKPPSVVVKHSYVPIRAGGIQTASQSDLDLDLSATSSRDSLVSARSSRLEVAGSSSGPVRTPSDGPRGFGMGLAPRIEGVPLRFRSHSHNSDSHVVVSRRPSIQIDILPDDQALPSKASLGTPTLPEADSPAGSNRTRSRKPSANDLRSTYRTQLPFASGLGSGAVVGLERIKKTSKAMGEYLGLTRSHGHRHDGNAISKDTEQDEAGWCHTSVPDRRRLSKGVMGIEPAEAVSRGWKGAGWRLALEPEIVTPIGLHGSSAFEATGLTQSKGQQHVRQVSDISV